MEITLIIAALAAWRITKAINEEKIGEGVRRKFAGEREDALGMLTYKDTFLAKLILCFWCLSFWVGVFCTLMVFIYPYFLYPFAISTAAIFLEEVHKHG